MKSDNRIIRLSSGTWHLATVIATTIITIAASLYYLRSGRFIIFQNLFYFPIIISCIYYFKRGFVFSVGLAFVYILLIVAYTADYIIIREALIRTVMFIAIAGVVTFLALQHRKADEELKTTKDFIETVFNSISDSLYVIDTATFAIVAANETFKNIYGKDKDQVIGKHCYELTHKRSEPCAPPDEPCPLKETLKTGHPSNVEHVHNDSAGMKHYSEISVFPIRNKQGEIYQIIHIDRDITERKQLEEKLRTMSIVDELTGLYNRRGFFALAQQQMNVTERTGHDILLFFVDLDKMKQINDIFGHKEGDNALIEIASILKDVFRKTDIIGRMGGDEFAILAMDTNDEIREVLIKRLQTIMENHNRTEGKKYQVSLSVGIAQYNPEHHASLDDLMAHADTLMYKEKNEKY